MIQQRWRSLPITRKFGITFGLLLCLILLVSLISSVSLAIVRYQLDARILTSTDIEVLVLEINQKLDQARRLERDFFLRYPEIGLTQAHEQYAEPAVAQITELVALSEVLKQRLAESEVHEALQADSVNLNLFLSSAKRNGEVFVETVDLVTALAGEDKGAISRLNQTSKSLRQVLGELTNDESMDLFRDMLDEEKQYLLTRQRPHLQSVFNLTDDLRQILVNQQATEPELSEKALGLLAEYRAIAEEIITLDVAIRAKFNDFDLQAAMVEPISARLLELAKTEVMEARTQTEYLSQLAGFLVVIITMMGLSIALGVVYLLNRSVTQPIIHLTQVANQLQHGRFEVKAVVNSHDELGQLALAFNEMAAQINQLVNNLEQQVQERTHRLELVAILGERFNAILEIDLLLFEIVNQIRDKFGYYHAQVYWVNDTQTTLTLAEGAGEAGRVMRQQAHAISLTSDKSIAVQAWQSQEAIKVDDVTSMAGWLPNPWLPETHSEMAVPIIIADKVLGVLDVHSNQKAGFDEGDSNLLRTLASQVGVALTNARLFMENKVALKETATLYAMSQRIIKASNLSELVAAVVEETGLAAINRAVLGVFEYDSSGAVKAMTVAGNWYRGVGQPPVEVGIRYPSEMLRDLEIVWRKEPLFVDDVQLLNLSHPLLQSELGRSSLRCMAVLPLQVQQQQLGLLLLQGEQPYHFGEREVRPYLSMLGQLATAVQNQYLYVQTLQAKQEAEQARIRADLANQAKSEFLSSMSHELRTPLNGILGYTQILKRDKTLTMLQSDGLNIIEQSGQHLLMLINDVLDLSKIEAGRLELVTASVVLGRFLEAVVGMMQLRAQQKGLAFSYHFAPTLPLAIEADEKRLRQVLLNLLNNAMKFTVAGQVVFNIVDLGFKTGQHWIRFEVTDTGVGIASADLEKIFQPFEQVGDRNQRAEGTGLGLAISRRLVETMGGQLQVESVLGGGSRFWFEVGFTTAPMNIQGEIKVMQAQRVVVGYKGDKRKILVVDDKADNRSVLVNMLAPLGFEIIVATNGQEAIDQAVAVRPDLIMMDMIMPVLTGFEATQAIRQIPFLQKIVIVGASASALEQDKQQTKLAGCDAFIAKPINLEELLGVFETLLPLEWVYEAEETEVAAGQTEVVAAVGADPQWVVPPREKLLILLDLAKRGSMQKIRKQLAEWVEAQPNYKPFADKVLELAKQFQDKAILALLEQSLEV